MAVQCRPGFKVKTERKKDHLNRSRNFIEMGRV